MDHMMNGMEDTMWGIELVGVLAVVLLILAIAALVKFLFFNN
ncbi:MAG: hypothetical protein ACRBM6_11255 [Geminicoccales bacterium]